MTAGDKKNRLQAMEQLHLFLLAELLKEFDVETIVVEPMADDFQDTVPANYWQADTKEAGND